MLRLQLNHVIKSGPSNQDDTIIKIFFYELREKLTPWAIHWNCVISVEVDNDLLWWYRLTLSKVEQPLKKTVFKRRLCCCWSESLTHWGRVTHICVGKLIIIGWDNGLSPDRRQAIISTNAGLLSIRPFREYFSENLIKIQQFSLKKMHMKMSSAKWRPSCLGLNVLMSTMCFDIGNRISQ